MITNEDWNFQPQIIIDEETVGRVGNFHNSRISDTLWAWKGPEKKMVMLNFSWCVCTVLVWPWNIKRTTERDQLWETPYALQCWGEQVHSPTAPSPWSRLTSSLVCRVVCLYLSLSVLSHPAHPITSTNLPCHSVQPKQHGITYPKIFLILWGRG